MRRIGMIFFFSSRRRHTRWTGDWSSDVCSSDLVDDHLGLVGAGGGADVDGLEEPEVVEPLLGPLQLLQGEELTFVHRDLTAEDLVLGPDVAGDVDALDVGLGAFVDVEHDVHPGRYLHLFGPRVHIGRSVADGAVEVGDLAKGIAQLRAREDVAFLELHHAEHFGLGEQRHPGDGQVLETVLRTLHHGEDQVHSRLLAVDLNFVALDAGLDVAVVVVDGQDALDVLIDPLALELARQDPELALLGGQRLLDLALVEAPGAPDNDLVDADATALVDAEDDLDVAV